MTARLPLNGTKTHPLKPGSLSVLKGLRNFGPLPAIEINPGVRDRLTREEPPLIVEVQRPSPFKKDKGGTCAHYDITEAGRAALAAAGF